MFEEQEAKKKEMQRYVDKHLHKGTPNPAAPTSAPGLVWAHPCHICPGTGLGSPLPHLRLDRAQPRPHRHLQRDLASHAAPALVAARPPAFVGLAAPRSFAAVHALFSAPCCARVCVFVYLCVCLLCSGASLSRDDSQVRPP